MSGLQAEWTDWQLLSLGQLRSDGLRYFVIEIGASWCSNCADDQPAMMQLEADYRAKAVVGMEILVEGGYDIPASPMDLDEWSRDHGATGTLLIDANRAFDRAADIVAIPSYFIVDASTMQIVVRSTDTLAGTPLGPALDSAAVALAAA